MIDSEVTLLPQPDSPTSPRTSPVSIVKLTPSTARSSPWLVAKWVSSPSTDRRDATSHLQPWVERVTQPVAQQIHGEDGQHDGEPGKRREPPGRRDVVPSIGQHPAPGRRRRLHAEP